MNLSEKLAAADDACRAAGARSRSLATAGPAIPAGRRSGVGPARSDRRARRGTRCGGPPTGRRSTSSGSSPRRRSRPRCWPRSPRRRPTCRRTSCGTKVRSTVNEILEREDIGISPIERQRFVEEMLEDSLGYGPLEALLADGTITEIMCNAYDEIWIERKGRIERSEIVFNSPHQYRRIIDRMVHGVGRRVDESSPMVDARLADGSRINAIVPPLALRGPVLTIRKFPERAFWSCRTSSTWARSPWTRRVFLEACVRGKISMVVVGGTGTGKTTMLNVLSNFIPDGERLITIEESAELQIQGAHVVTLETRPSNAEGTGEVAHPRPRAQLPAYAARPDHRR